MEILQVTGFYPPSLGGIQSFVQGLSGALVRRGHRVSVLTINTEQVDRDELEPEGVRVRRCKLDAHYHRGLVSSEFTSRLLRAKRYDVYHVHSPFPLGLEISALASRINRVPLVATHHGQGVQGGGLYALLAGGYAFLNRALSMRAARAMVFLTQSYVNSLWLPKRVRQRVRVVPTGADIENFAPDCNGSLVRRSYGLDEKAPLLLFVGRLDEGNRYKGVDRLIRAMSTVRDQVADVHLLIVGGGTWVPELEALARQLELERVVTFAGPIENSRLPAYYAASDLLVLPSVPGGSENSPIAVFEAMASGVPVVASRLPGVSEIVQHGETGLLVPAGDVEALAAALVEAIQGHEFRTCAGTKARAKAESYSWNHCAAQMEGIYEEWVGR